VLEVGQQVAEVLVHRCGGPTEVDHDKATGNSARDLHQAEALEPEVLDLVHVRGGAQGAVKVVEPGVIGALQPTPDLALRLLDQPSATVTADVVKRARGRPPSPSR